MYIPLRYANQKTKTSVPQDPYLQHEKKSNLEEGGMIHQNDREWL
jgi:hypothetical protein